MERTPFTVATPTGELSGWVTGEGPRVLATHGGPGMSYDHLDDAPGCVVAAMDRLVGAA